MSDPMDERYATFREHAELRERTATLEETVRQVGPSLNRIETMIVAQKSAPAQHDAVSLALQRAADLFERQRPSGAGIGTMILVGFGMFGVGVACFLIGKVFF